MTSGEGGLCLEMNSETKALVIFLNILSLTAQLTQTMQL